MRFFFQNERINTFIKICVCTNFNVITLFSVMWQVLVGNMYGENSSTQNAESPNYPSLVSMYQFQSQLLDKKKCYLCTFSQ